MAAPRRNRLATIAWCAFVAAVVGCDDGARTGGVIAPPTRSQDAAVAQLEASSLDAPPGARILVVVRVSGGTSEDPIEGMQSAVRFDPAKLAYAGQIAEMPTLAMVSYGRAAQGVIHLMSVNARGL